MTETRWPCPVCLGTRMEKTSLGTGAGDAPGPLTLDHCARCGGMWFELGEVQRLRSERPESLWAQIAARDERHRAQCHTCRAFVDRDAPKCAACGAKTRLNCPACDTRMLQVRQSSLTLDVCKRCKGVWFDHHELEAIWETGARPAHRAAGAATERSRAPRTRARMSCSRRSSGRRTSSSWGRTSPATPWRPRRRRRRPRSTPSAMRPRACSRRSSRSSAASSADAGPRIRRGAPVRYTPSSL